VHFILADRAVEINNNITMDERKESKSDEAIGKHRRYYIPKEVSLHNAVDDCWVCVFGKVYDISYLLVNVSSSEESLVTPIVAHAGQDVSHWFDEETGDVIKEIDPVTGLSTPHLPYGRFVHVPPSEPVSNWSTEFDEPWWRDEAFCIGSLSSAPRSIIVRNMLTYQESVLQVCEEETIEEIQDRYMDWNRHSGSYTWKVLDEDVFRPLDMTLTLTENGVPDESSQLKKLSIPIEKFIPMIHAYFNDDLSEA